jgi:predicted phage terminase large subunit-like protein
MDNKVVMAKLFSDAKKDLLLFRKVFLPVPGKELPTPEYQKEWGNVLIRGEHHYAVEGYRESGKSSLVLRAFPLHCLTYPSKKNQYIVFIMANQSSASKRLKEIETEWLHDELLSMNLVRVVEQSATGFEVIVKDDNGEEMWVRLEAYGKGSAVRGLLVHDCRPSLVLIDDPQDTDDSKSDTVQENDWEWFLSDILFLGKETRIFLIGNNLGEKCLIERIIENQKDLGFVGVRIPILDMEGNSVWPERWSTEDVIAERESMRRIGKLDVWEREKMCLAISPESQLFRKEYFRYYEPQNLHIRDLNVFTTVDLAISKKETADYTVVCTIGVNADNQWFLLDVQFGRWDPSESMDHIFEAVTRYKPLYVGIEKVAYQAALSHFIEKEMPKRNIFFTTKDLEAKEKKEERIKAIQPRFKAGTVMFAKGASYLGELESELLAFPKSLHDDLIDALAYQDQIYFAPVSSFEKVEGEQIPLAGAM